MLSQKTRYTIRALQHLADLYPEGRAQMGEIAEAQNIPAKFLTVILSEMARAGIVLSQRGRDGGYQLALHPVDIRYGDIVRITRGSLALVPCASRYAHEKCDHCLPESECRLRALMLKVRDETAAILDSITLADPIEGVPEFIEDQL
ncbi:Rrf2 family transcriptional regulator [Altererythrobacter sp. CC-YST694]|uniref:RrF2 family transcriptional regulator n=1 Tax=Altererythrobacter sp. CC-YST694 TaxID=2755038 RepID=UPI001D00AA5B|nr:Rrf2 family transcriptional regulator [Altererythrobacter sp. CC-YST694]MCB5426401.1 Rrf2 family transcriptional regulator [Altererythrobacter sp. CC-YST694]